LRGNLNKGQLEKPEKPEKPVFLTDEGNEGKENAQKRGF
jgi:hypothetical protein